MSMSAPIVRFPVLPPLFVTRPLAILFHHPLEHIEH
jgi:hypothetical protein